MPSAPWILHGFRAGSYTGSEIIPVIPFRGTKATAWIFNVENRAEAEVGGVLGKQLEGFELGVGEERSGGTGTHTPQDRQPWLEGALGIRGNFSLNLKLDEGLQGRGSGAELVQ